MTAMKMAPLYKIKVEHDYFSNARPRQLKFATHRECADLFRRRGLSLYSPGRSTVEVLFDADGGGLDTKNDIIKLTLESHDPQFLLYTDWEDINPAAGYRLSLSGDSSIEDASKAFEMVTPSRGIGVKLFEIAIQPTDEMIERAKVGEPVCCTLHFLAPDRYWEYLILIQNTEDMGLISRLGKAVITACDTARKSSVDFSSFQIATIDSGVSLRARSMEKIPMRERYNIDVRMETESPSGGGMKQCLISNMKHPELGKYQSDDLETLRIIIQK